MERTHEESVYQCPGCLTTCLGAELNERRTEWSLRRRTACCNERPVLVMDSSDYSFLHWALKAEA